MTAVRPAAVAGAFYPASPRELETTVRHHLSQVKTIAGPVPKAVIAPHAGFIYSGPVAASVYERIRPARDTITRVVLLGPCHRVAVRGLAASSAEAFATPLGDVPVDTDAVKRLLALPQVEVFDLTHAQEHCLEVHLPFLQLVLSKFSIVPLVVGEASNEEVAQVLDQLWGGSETLILVSSDLSHYQDYDTAQRLDGATCKAIEALEPDGIGTDQACGRIPVKGLLTTARRRGLRVSTVDVRNSGDTAGPRNQVVGYGSWAFFEGAAASAIHPDGSDKATDFANQTRALLDVHGSRLLHLAAASIEHGLKNGRSLPVDPADHPPDLGKPGACFVTLYRNGNLRGCIGSSAAHRPLVVDVAENAFSSAFKDGRFPQLAADERTGLDLSISVLSPPSPMAFADESDLISQLRRGADGLIIADEGRRALYLPSVWAVLPEPTQFLGQLKLKAGLAQDHWSSGFKAWRFATEEMVSTELEKPSALWSGIL